MKALLKKELHGLLNETMFAGFIGGLGLVAAGRLVLDYGPPGFKVGDGIEIYALALLLIGASLGYWQNYVERKEGTEAYLIHRATGAAKAFDAKVLAGLISLPLLVVTVLAIHASWFVISSAGGLARWERLWEHLALSTMILSGYGLGLWTSVLPRAESTRFLVLLLACASTFALSSLTSLRWDGGPSAPVVRFALVQLALAAAFTWQARRTYLSAVEPERPLAGRLSLWNVPLALIGLGIPFGLLQSSLQRGLRSRALSNREQIVQGPDGELFLAGRSGKVANGFVRFDESGLPESEELLSYTGWGRGGEEDYLTVFDLAHTPLAWGTPAPPPLSRRFVGKPFELSNSWLAIRWLRRPEPPRTDPTAWLDQATGWVHAAELSLGEAIGMRRLGKGSSSERFSPSTVPVFAAEGSGACLVDRSDASAWRFEGQGADARLLPAPLPEGERLIDVERVHSSWRIRVGLYEPYGVSDTLIARGERGLWSWTDAGWVPYEPWPGYVLESQAPAAIELRVRNANGDGLAPRIEVLDARTGELRFAHDYLPRTGVQKLALLAAQGFAVLRPPLASLLALRQDAGAPERMRRPLDRFVLDPALAGGHRAWLALLGFLLALGLAMIASWHLGRSSADRALRLLWMTFIAILGLPAFVACCFVEPRRAKRLAARIQEPGSEGSRRHLLIASAS